MLKSRMTAVEPRETGGSDGQRGLDFQNHWAICLLLKLHQDSDDYAILIEHWDDVVSLDSSYEPEAITFYQVKDYKKISVADILRYDKKKDGSSSIVHKLHDLYKNFGDCVEGCCLVTSKKLVNSKGKPVVDSDDWMCANEVPECADIRAGIEDEVEEECSRFGYVMRIMNSELANRGYENQLKGLIYTFFKEQYDCDVDVEAFYTTLLRDVVKKGVLKVGKCGDHSELIERKGFTRVQIDNFIRSIVSKTKHSDVVSIIQSLLSKDVADIGDQYKIMKNVYQYQSEKMQYNDDVIYELEEDILRHVDEELHNGGPIPDIVKRIHGKLDSSKGYLKLYPPDFIDGAIYYESAKSYGQL